MLFGRKTRAHAEARAASVRANASQHDSRQPSHANRFRSRRYFAFIAAVMKPAGRGSRGSASWFPAEPLIGIPAQKRGSVCDLRDIAFLSARFWPVGYPVAPGRRGFWSLNLNHKLNAVTRAW